MPIIDAVDLKLMRPGVNGKGMPGKQNLPVQMAGSFQKRIKPGMVLKGNESFDHKPDLRDGKTNGKNRLEREP